MLKPIRVSLLMLTDTTYCERGLAEYGSVHDDQRARLTVSKVRQVMAVRHYGPPSRVFLPSADVPLIHVALGG